MPELIYTVKVVLDPSSEKIVGKAIDEGLEKGIKDAAAAIEKATGKQVNFNKVIEESNKEIKEMNNLLKGNITNVESANAQARNYDNTLKRLITDEKTDIATLKQKAEQHKRFIPVLEESITEMRAYGAATEMSQEESIRYNRVLAKSEQTLRTMMSTHVNLNNSLQQAAGEMGDVTGQAGKFNKTMSGANQTIFAFSDLVQDSTQFMIGGRFNFAQGMRAIGNNVGFTAELFGNLRQNVQRYNQAIADGTIKNGQQVTTLQAVRKSLLSTGGVVLALNAAITIGTILLDKFGKKAKDAAKDLDEANKAAERFLQTNNSLIEALKEVGVLTSEESIRRRELANIDAEINRLQLIEQQSQSERQRLNDEINSLKIKKESISISRTSTFLTESETAAIAQKNELIAEIEDKEKRLESLNSEKEERASRINDLQKEQMKLGAQITIDTEQAAVAEAEALDILARRRQEGQAIVDLLKEGRDLPPVRIAGEIILGKIGEDELGKDILGEILSPDMPELDLNKARIDANKAMFDAMFEDADAYAKAQRALNIDVANTEINTRRMVLSTLSSLSGAFAEENKGIAFALLAIEKGLAIADVIVDGTKRAGMAANAAAFFSANPFTTALGASYTASAAAIKANTAATVAAIAAQGIGQAASISRAGGARTSSATSAGQTGVQEFFGSMSATGATTQNISFRPSNESDMFDLKIKNEVVVTPKGLALITRAGEREIANSQKSVR